MAVVSRIATVRVTTVLGAYREWVATATVQDYAAGTTQNIVVTSTTSGAVPPIVEDTLALDVYADDGQTLIRNYSLTAGSASQTVSLYMTANGQSGGTSVADTFRLRLRAIKTTGLGTDTYNVNSDNGSYGSPASTPMTGGSASATSAGYVRGTTTATGTVSNASYGGAKPNPFAYNDQVFLRYVLGAQPAISRTNTITFGPLSAAVASTTTTFQNTFGTSGTGTLIANNWTIGLTSNQATGITIANATLTGQPYTVIPQIFADSSGNGKDATLQGAHYTTQPAASPFTGMGNAPVFNGTNQYLDCKSIADGGPAAVSGTGNAAKFCLEMKVRTGATAPNQGLAGRYRSVTVAGEGQPLLYIAGGDFAALTLDTSGTLVTITGPAVSANTSYDLAYDYDGTTARLFVNGALSGSIALSGVQAAATYVRFLIGAYDVIGSPGLSNCTIDEVRWSNTSRHTSAYTPSTTPFTADANTLGLWHLDSWTQAGLVNDTANVDPRRTSAQHAQGASSTRSGGSDKTSYVISADQLFVWSQALNARNEVISGWTMTQQLLASDATTVLVQNTAQVTQAADGWTPNPGVDFTSFVSAPSGNRTQKSFPNAPSNAVGLGTATRLLGFSSAFTANRGMNIVIPDEAGIGIQQTINFEYLQSDGTRVTLDSAPSVRVYSLNASGVQVDDLALTTMTQYSGQQCWSKAWTPTAAGVYSVEVRAPVAGAIIESARSITVRPKYTKAVAGIVGIL